MRKRLEKQVLGNYATKQAALLPVCHEVQHEYGWLPAQALEEVAEFLDLSGSQVLDTVTFYEEFRLKPLLVELKQTLSETALAAALERGKALGVNIVAQELLKDTSAG